MEHCTRDQYLHLLEETVRENSIAGCQNYLFNRHGKERCNHLGCSKTKGLYLHGEYKLCRLHGKNFEPHYAKQRRIYEEYYLQILIKQSSFLTNAVQAPPQEKSSLKKISKKFCPGHPKEETLDSSSQKLVTQEATVQPLLVIANGPCLVLVNKQTKPAVKECTRVGCSKKKSLKEKFRNFFCIEHAHELHQLRVFKRMPMTLTEDLYQPE